MVLADPAWLTTIGRIAGTILLLEVAGVLLVLTALVVALALGAWWLQEHVAPLLDQYGTQAVGAMGAAMKGSERVVRGVAEFRGRTVGIESAIRTFLLGRPRQRGEVIPPRTIPTTPTTPIVAPPQPRPVSPVPPMAPVARVETTTAADLDATEPGLQARLAADAHNGRH